MSKPRFSKTILGAAIARRIAIAQQEAGVTFDERRGSIQVDQDDAGALQAYLAFEALLALADDLDVDVPAAAQEASS
jgi:hypothetical protein